MIVFQGIIVFEKEPGSLFNCVTRRGNDVESTSREALTVLSFVIKYAGSYQSVVYRGNGGIGRCQLGIEGGNQYRVLNPNYLPVREVWTIRIL